MKAVIFDLDNTLYDVRQYYFGAFKKISNHLSKKYRIPKEKIYKILKKLWKEKTSLYPYLFDNLLKILNIENERVKNVIEIFNGYRGNLKLYPQANSVLKKLKKRSYKLGIITDGNVKRQKRKIKSLGIKNFFATIIYTKSVSPKPSEKPFLSAIKKLKVNPRDTFYVADNPLIDFKGAKKSGMKTVRILKGEFRNSPGNIYIDFEIKNFSDLLKIIS